MTNQLTPELKLLYRDTANGLLKSRDIFASTPARMLEHVLDVLEAQEQRIAELESQIDEEIAGGNW